MSYTWAFTRKKSFSCVGFYPTSIVNRSIYIVFASILAKDDIRSPLVVFQQESIALAAQDKHEKLLVKQR